MTLRLVTLLLLTSLPALADVPPPAIPSGMDLLYGTRIVVRANHEPIVPVGVTDKQPTLHLSSVGPVRMEYFEEGVLKSSQVASGQNVRLRVLRAQPATREHYIDLEGAPWNAPHLVKEAIRRWTERGFTDVRALEEGMVFGLGGTVMDNRSYRIVVPAPNARAARQITERIFLEFNHRALAHSRIVERPWGELKITVDGRSMGRATSYIRFRPINPTHSLRLHNVEFGRGYSWAGREDRHYHNELYAVIDPDGTLAAVSTVGVEAILRGVVPAEIFASAHPESLKAQAVAARTILFAQLGKRHYADPFHLCSTQHCQVYGGATKEDPRTSAAVDETAGEVLFANQRLINATYSSTCGGFTEHNDTAWKQSPSEVLRGKPDFPLSDATLAPFQAGITPENLPVWLETMPESFCHKAPQVQEDKIRWQQQYTGAELSALVAKRYPGVGEVQDLEVLSRGISGRAISLRIKGDKKTVTVLYELPIRRLFGNLRSGAFTVHLERAGTRLKHATFKGAGWGHGVGMCQMGAIGRAESGHTYQQILGHYYENVTLRRLYGPRKVAKK
ncbi:MAG: SpoIID/LytB domain-containing protein [Myxococcota bacterium]|nr:SpoIID/LytB domain-containing protein [Myxococcota bacterium]